MEVIFWSVISIFFVLGITYTVKELIRSSLSKKPGIVFYEYRSENDAEYDLRCIRMNYPDCKICVINNGEQSDILDKLIESTTNTELFN